MTKTLRYRIHEVAPYISWSYFFHAWGFPARFATIAHVHGCEGCRTQWLAGFSDADRPRAAEALQLHKEALRLLNRLDWSYKLYVRFGLFSCNSDGDDIILYISNKGVSRESIASIPLPAAGSSPEVVTPSSPAPPSSRFRLAFLRQQTAPFLCLADFIRPLNAEGKTDRIGIFAATAPAIGQLFADDSSDAPDPYRHLLCQTLADRLAEAATERAHEEIRRLHWGYVPDEQLPVADLLAGRFQGIRPAVGYPCLPDQSLNFELDRLIDFSAIGIRLTENGAMMPHASVSGLMLAHPQARYFAVGNIGRDQFADYVRRKGSTEGELLPFLASNLLA